MLDYSKYTSTSDAFYAKIARNEFGEIKHASDH